MKKSLMGILFGTLLLGSSAHANADQPPSCYAEDQNDIQDGQYLVTFTTHGRPAKDYANVLNFAAFGQSSVSTDAFIEYSGDGSDLSGATIQINLSAETETQYNQLVQGRTGATPFAQIKAGTLAFLSALGKKPGVTSIQCIKNVKPQPLAQ